jgi:tRNA (mo5U34)-methyltransferase
MGTAPAGDPVGRTINELAPWFHNLHLPGGRQTAPDHPLGDYPNYKWRAFSPCLPDDLSSATVLDIGCNAGAYSIGLAQRGAAVLAVDHDEHYLRQARWAADQFGVSDRIEFDRLGVYDLADLDATFDIVLFMGVLYHLRYPTLALDLVAEKVRKTLVFQALLVPGDEIVDTPEDLAFDDRDQMQASGWPAMAFIEHRLADDATNWWAPNKAAVEALLRSTGMTVVDRPGQDIYVCNPDKGVVDRSELHAALRRTPRDQEPG